MKNIKTLIFLIFLSILTGSVFLFASCSQNKQNNNDDWMPLPSTQEVKQSELYKYYVSQDVFGKKIFVTIFNYHKSDV